MGGASDAVYIVTLERGNYSKTIRTDSVSAQREYRLGSKHFIFVSKVKILTKLFTWRENGHSRVIAPLTRAMATISSLGTSKGAYLGLSDTHLIHSCLSEGWTLFIIMPWLCV